MSWRFLRAPAVLLGAVVALAIAVAALPWLSGTDPAQTVLRARAAERDPDPAALAAVRQELDLPDNAFNGAFGWLGGVLRGDFGLSWVTGRPVAPTVASAAGVSAGLAMAASAVALLVCLLVLLPNLWRVTGSGQPTGRVSGLVGAVLAALPEFLIASVLLIVVAVRWRLAPTSGWAGPAHVLLPSLALGIPAGGLLSRVLAGSVDATIGEPWVRTWRAAGLARAAVAAAVLRRALAVALPQILLLFVGLLGSAVTVESVFAVPGLGSTALRAVLAQDIPLVQGCVIVLVALGLAAGGVGILAHRALLGPAITTSGLAPSAPARSAGRRARWPLAVGAVLVVVIAVGLLRDPYANSLGARLQPPTWAYPFGTDALGRDLLARIAHGAVPTVGMAVAIIAVVGGIGLAAGLIGRGGRSGIADVLNALPPVFLGILVSAVTGPGPLGAALAVLLVGWVPLAVHGRTLATEARATGYLQAAVVGGAGPGWILRRHVLPAVFPPVARHALARIPHTALSLAALSFLGLGAAHDSPEWGRLLAESMVHAERAPWTIAFPAVSLALLGVLAAAVRTERR